MVRNLSIQEDDMTSYSSNNFNQSYKSINKRIQFQYCMVKIYAIPVELIACRNWVFCPELCNCSSHKDLPITDKKPEINVLLALLRIGLRSQQDELKCLTL